MCERKWFGPSSYGARRDLVEPAAPSRSRVARLRAFPDRQPDFPQRPQLHAPLHYQQPTRAVLDDFVTIVRENWGKLNPECNQSCDVAFDLWYRASLVVSC